MIRNPYYYPQTPGIKLSFNYEFPSEFSAFILNSSIILSKILSFSYEEHIFFSLNPSKYSLPSLINKRNIKQMYSS